MKLFCKGKPRLTTELIHNVHKLHLVALSGKKYFRTSSIFSKAPSVQACDPVGEKLFDAINTSSLTDGFIILAET